MSSPFESDLPPNMEEGKRRSEYQGSRSVDPAYGQDTPGGGVTQRTPEDPDPFHPGASTCSLGHTYWSVTEEGDIYIAAGVINAGGVHEIVGGVETTFTPTIGYVVYAEVELEAGLTDDDDPIFDGTWEATDGSAAVNTGSTIPDDHAWTDSSPTGNAYRLLGSWVADGAGNPKWEYYGCGDVTFKLCINFARYAVAYSYRS